MQRRKSEKFIILVLLLLIAVPDSSTNFEELLRKLQGKNFDAPVKEKSKAQGTNPGNSTS